MDSVFPYVILGLSILSGVLGLVLLASVFRQPRGGQGPAQRVSQPVEPGNTGVVPAGAVATARPWGEAGAAETGTSSAPSGPQLQVAAMSSAGYVRELNEDCVLSLHLSTVRQSQPLAVHLLAVADGMGGQRAGEIASAIAARVLAEQVSHQLLFVPVDPAGAAAPDYLELLRQAVREANSEIRKAGQDQLKGMGTTLVAALVVEDQVYLANVGDSRAYVVTPGDIRQITVDHSLVEHLVATDQITREEASTHPERHLIYRSLGQTAEIDVDTFGQALAAGEWLLLCSDGLNRMLSDAEIQALVAAAPTPQAGAAALVEKANAAGGEDNITVVLARIA